MALIEINWKPDRRQLRWFGGACAVICGALGGWLAATGHLFGFALSAGAAQTTAWVLFSVAAAAAVLCAAAPAALRPLFVTLTVLTLPIGWVVSHVVLAVVFYGVITPFALVFRLIGRDPLGRRIDPDAETYWVPRKPVKDPRRYFRQF
jgi:hypothetical protein